MNLKLAKTKQKNKKQEQSLLEIVFATIEKQPATENDFMDINRKVSSRYELPPQPKNLLRSVYQKLINEQKIKDDPKINKFFKIRPIRTLSGVTPVTVLTKPAGCPGKCVYCPQEPGMPRSYLSTEPGAMRALANKFDPYMMVHNRLRALYVNGHQPDKIELLVLGGTWSAYDMDYREWFIKRCFEGANYFHYKYNNLKIPKNIRSYTLEQAQKINETADYRIIGITLETRPDWVDEAEVKHLRKVGCTRVQLGIQALDDNVLAITKRGHIVTDSIQATNLLRQNGFKIDHHVMQNLPGATPEIDKATLFGVFNNPGLKPDQIKIYPTIVNKYAPLYKWWQDGRYQPYGHDKLFELLIELKKLVPYYCRINRLVRDFPAESIQAGNKITNLREMLDMEMKKRNLKCKCIRCREARKIETTTEAELFIEQYETDGGTEYFISYENYDRSIIFGFVRLRLNTSAANVIFPEIKNAALVRELHVYGQVVRHDDKNAGKIQHQGLGTQLMNKAEKIAREHGFQKMAVISGIGVREYYKNKLGYHLEGAYMVKSLEL